jgi:hypothetical protein
LQLKKVPSHLLPQFQLCKLPRQSFEAKHISQDTSFFIRGNHVLKRSILKFLRTKPSLEHSFTSGTLRRFIEAEFPTINEQVFEIEKEAELTIGRQSPLAAYGPEAGIALCAAFHPKLM